VLAPDGVSEMAVRGEAGGERDERDALARFEELLQRVAEPEANEHAVNRHSGSRRDQPAQVEG
jgi:hypothetical protein